MSGQENMDTLGIVIIVADIRSLPSLVWPGKHGHFRNCHYCGWYKVTAESCLARKTWTLQELSLLWLCSWISRVICYLFCFLVFFFVFFFVFFCFLLFFFCLLLLFFFFWIDLYSSKWVLVAVGKHLSILYHCVCNIFLSFVIIGPIRKSL